MISTINQQTVIQLSKISNIELSPKQIAELKIAFQETVSTISHIKKLKLDSLVASYQLPDQKMILRKDQVDNPPVDISKMGLNTHQHYFKAAKT